MRNLGHGNGVFGQEKGRMGKTDKAIIILTKAEDNFNGGLPFFDGGCKVLLF